MNATLDNTRKTTQATLRLGLFWQCYGPYHLARLAALREAAVGRFEILPVEVAGVSTTYAWRRDEGYAPPVHALLPGGRAEQGGLFRIFLLMRRWLRATAVDVLFVPSYWPGYALGASLAARSVGVPVVMMTDSHHASGGNGELALLLKAQLLRIADAAFVAGGTHRAFMRRLGMPAERIFDGYDVVDNDYFIRASDAARADAGRWRLKLGLPVRYLLSLGRLVRKKNVGLIIRAYARLAETGAHAGHHLVIVGSGPERESLIALALSLRLPVATGESEQALSDGGVGVHFCPFAQVNETPVYYALARAFVLASRTDEWGLVINEAMACGLPVVASRSVGAVPDLVRSGETGFRFSAENAEELALCLERVCRVGDEAERMGRLARAEINLWSLSRFTAGALGAAEMALRPWDHRRVRPADHFGTRRDIRLLQTCLPDYRVPVFSEAVRRLPAELRLYSGADYFTPDVRVTEDYHDWRFLLHNRYFLGRKLLWQPKAVARMLEADVAVMELNPRILSNWVILAVRALFGAPSVLWGHAWAREGERKPMNILRLLMMRLSSAVLTYTHTQRLQLSRMLPGKAIFTAPNSLVPALDCVPAPGREGELNRVLYVGRLNATKRVDLLVRGFAIAVPKLPPQVELCIVGEGAERSMLETLIKKLGVVDRVRLLGHISTHDILRELYGRAFCSASPGYVGLSCIQSFAFGVPLLIADKEPHAPEIEACVEGANSVFFRAGDEDDLAAKLGLLWTEREAWFRRRGELSANIAANYSVERMVGGLISAIDSVAPPIEGLREESLLSPPIHAPKPL